MGWKPEPYSVGEGGCHRCGGGRRSVPVGGLVLLWGKGCDPGTQGTLLVLKLVSVLVFLTGIERPGFPLLPWQSPLRPLSLHLKKG